MRIPNTITFPQEPLLGKGPELFWGDDAIDTSSRFTSKPVGSVYYFTRQSGATYGVVEKWVKIFDQNLVSDWRCESGILSERISVDDFTDGGSTAGTLVLTADLPAGAFVMASQVSQVTGFAGDTSAVLAIGDGSDADRYNTGTYNVFADSSFAGDTLAEGAPSGNRGHVSAMTTITVTVTSAADFTSVSAGAATVSLFYLI